jgi:hypothetical protein
MPPVIIWIVDFIALARSKSPYSGVLLLHFSLK